MYLGGLFYFTNTVEKQILAPHKQTNKQTKEFKPARAEKELHICAAHQAKKQRQKTVLGGKGRLKLAR